jgi:hypothetical protein
VAFKSKLKMGVLSKVLQTKKELEVKGVHETKTINECL